jgi:hypothetical protein
MAGFNPEEVLRKLSEHQFRAEGQIPKIATCAQSSQNLRPSLSNVGFGESCAASIISWVTENRANSGEIPRI